jgi:hypothetical protein
MMRIENTGFFGGNGTIPLMGAAPRSVPARQMAQAQQPMPARAVEARAMLEKAVKDLTSAEDNLDILDATMGPEAALQALEEGHESVDRARQEYQRVLAEESA